MTDYVLGEQQYLWKLAPVHKTQTVHPQPQTYICKQKQVSWVFPALSIKIFSETNPNRLEASFWTHEQEVQSELDHLHNRDHPKTSVTTHTKLLQTL